MQYIEIHRGRDGTTLDPAGYLAAMAGMAARLPAGALAFATDPQHYDFTARRCVKDLVPAGLTSGGRGRAAWAELRLTHSCWKHEEDLAIRYHGVRSVVTDPHTAATDVADLGDVLLDEVLPGEHGCRHEIAFLAGSLTVACEDLVATWRPARCRQQ